MTATLFTIHAAEKIDQGPHEARTDISAIKVYVPDAHHRVADRPTRCGRAGVSNDPPLAGGRWGHARQAGRRAGRGAQDPHRRERARSVRSIPARAGTGAH